VPVIIVGNLSVGGTGKTPLVAWLALSLQKQGKKPGIVMRGYRSHLPSRQVMQVTQESDPLYVGDEPFLLAKKTRCPVVIGKNRSQAVRYLLIHSPEVDLVLCDDGLQHYALARDVEIAVVDGERQLGNGACLPAGPLRENLKRLERVDFIVMNGEGSLFSHSKPLWMMKKAFSPMVCPVNAGGTPQRLSLFEGKTVHVVAGIGHPERFFSMLREKNIHIIPHIFRDHHYFQQSDLTFNDTLPILMTEKDAVKCQALSLSNAWMLPLEVSLPETFIHHLLKRINHGQKIA